jgi:hypothetical protein
VPCRSIRPAQPSGVRAIPPPRVESGPRCKHNARALTGTGEVAERLTDRQDCRSGRAKRARRASARDGASQCTGPGRPNTTIWRGGRAVECTGLENQQRFVAFRGFESHPLRQKTERPPRGAFLFSGRVRFGPSNPVRRAQRRSRMPGREATIPPRFPTILETTPREPMSNPRKPSSCAGRVFWARARITWRPNRHTIGR